LFFSIKKLFKKIINLFVFIIVSALIIGLVGSILYPMGYKEYIKKYSFENDLDPFLVAAIINVESNYNKDAISPKDARGLMQIGPQTGLWAKEELGINNYSEDLLFDPETNIKIGTWYLTKLDAEFNGNVDTILAAYNAGSGNVSKWLDDIEHSRDNINLYNIPFKETEEYVEKVKKDYKIYSTFYKPFIHKSFIDDTIYMEIRTFLKQNIKVK
jgi:peptidoglycan lytic transglycosylase